MNDQQLIERFLARRDDRSFRAIYRRHAPKLYPLLKRLLAGPQAELEDAFQDCWIRIVEGLPNFEWRASFRTWYSSIALNCAREHWRRRAMVELPSEQVDESPASQASAEARMDLEAALIHLAEGYREVIVLHDLQGYSHDEIAELLGIANGTSKSQLSRARQALKKLMKVENAS